MSRLADRAWDALLARPERALAVFALAYAALWTGVQLATFESLRLDAVESLAFAREWPMGTFKHPPLPNWLHEIAFRATGGWVESAAALAALCVLVTFAFVAALGRAIGGPVFGALGALLLVGNYFFLEPLTQYNHNIAQLPFWAACMFFYQRALARGGLGSWIGLGVAAAGLMLCKYAGAFLLIAIALHALATLRGRRALAGLGPWLAAGLCVALLAPHLVWLVRSDFLPFAYATARASQGPLAAAGQALRFLAAQIGFQAPMLLLVLAAAWPFGRRPSAARVIRLEAGAEDRALVIALTVLPLLLLGLSTILLDVDPLDRWGGSMTPTTGLALLCALPRDLVVRAPRLAAALWFGLLVLPPFGAALHQQVAGAASGDSRPSRTPARAIAADLDAAWTRATGRPLGIVAGDVYAAGIVAVYGPTRPSLLPDGVLRYAPWIGRARLDREGALYVQALPFRVEGVAPLPADLAGRPVLGAGVIEAPRRGLVAHRPMLLRYVIVGPTEGGGASSARSSSASTR